VSAYTDAIMSLVPLFHHDLNEATGTFGNRNGFTGGTSLTAVGTVQRATQSMMPGEASNSLSQDKEGPMASRAHNVTWDLAVTRMTLLAWVKPARIKTTSQPLVIKGAQYSMNLLDSRVNVQWGMSGGTQQFNTGSDLIVADQAFFVAASYDDSPAEVTTFVNGVERQRQAITHSTLAANTTVFQVGGQNFFGAGGLSGALQHVSVFFNTVLTPTQIQSLYEIGMASQAEIADQGANAYPWSRQILSPSSRTTLRATNESDVTVYLSLGATATVGGGYPLAPGQSTGHDLDGYTGALSVIHGNASGAKRLALLVR
jgi:hypothetical protein